MEKASLTTEEIHALIHIARRLALNEKPGLKGARLNWFLARVQAIAEAALIDAADELMPHEIADTIENMDGWRVEIDLDDPMESTIYWPTK